MKYYDTLGTGNLRTTDLTATPLDHAITNPKSGTKDYNFVNMHKYNHGHIGDKSWREWGDMTEFTANGHYL